MANLSELINVRPVEDLKTPDELTEFTLEQSFRNQSEWLAEKLQQEKQRTQWHITYSKALDDERKARVWYGFGVFSFVGLYICAVLSVVFLQIKYPINDKIVMVLLGTTSINVIGLLTAVVKFLFSNNHHHFMSENFPDKNN